MLKPDKEAFYLMFWLEFGVFPWAHACGTLLKVTGSGGGGGLEGIGVGVGSGNSSLEVGLKDNTDFWG